MTHRWIPWLGFFLALGLHLWRISVPATFISDEWYFVRDGQRYLQHRNYRDAHPPLGKMQLGAAFAVFGYRPFTWRVVNAVEGALLTPTVWWLGWLLTHRRRVAALVGGLALLMGVTITDSRTGLINIPYVLYGMVAVGCVLRAVQATRPRPWLAAAGLLIGLAVSVKWLAVLTAVPTVWLWFWPSAFGWSRQGRLAAIESMAWLVVLPLAVYVAVFAAHFVWLGLEPNIIAMNVNMWLHHTHRQVGHPFAEPWWGWFVMWRLFPYYASHGQEIFSRLWSIANPWLWWTGWLIIAWAAVRRWTNRAYRTALIVFLFAWVPLMMTGRDMFFYHAIPMALAMAIIMALAVDELWALHRPAAIGYLTVAVLIWLWFLPWLMNIPLSAKEQRWREWLPPWRYRYEDKAVTAAAGVPAWRIVVSTASRPAPVRSAYASAAAMTRLKSGPGDQPRAMRSRP